MLHARLRAAAGGSSFSIASLFSASEQGVWYDPSDLSTMFTDTGATNNVTADGDSVRYLMDKSGNAVHLSNATGLVYRTDGAYHWLELSGTYLTSPSGSKSKMAFAHSPGGGFTGCYGVRFGTSSNPGTAYMLYSNGGATGSKTGINFQFDDRAAQSRNNQIIHLTGPDATVNNPPILAATANGYITPNINVVLSEVATPDAATATDRHLMRFIGASDVKNNAKTGAPSSADASDEFTLGRASGSTFGAMTGRIYQFVIVEGQLAESVRADLESAVQGLTP